MRRTRVRGFTLLELLAALALTAALFAALTQFVFSLGELWGRGAQRRLFERHASAVATHLQDMFSAAVGTTEANAPAIGGVLEAGGTGYLTLELPSGDRLFSHDGQRPADVLCLMRVDEGTGLVLQWATRPESNASTGRFRTTVMTPLVQLLEYEYYDRDSRRWSTHAAPQKDPAGRWLVPWRLRLKFGWDRLSTVRTVAVPGHTDALPSF